MANTNWIAGAIKRPGALHAAAKKAGKVTPAGTINKAWLSQQAGSNDQRRAAQAQLAIRLAKMRKAKGRQ
jgi:hypothetical protein